MTTMWDDTGRVDVGTPCERCLRPIVFALVEESDGRIRARSDDPTRFSYVRLNAEPVAWGDYEYVRGSARRPVVRALDDPEKRVRGDSDRYTRHLDTVREER